MEIMNSTLQVIHDRHSIRIFEEREIHEHMIQAILDAANQAPSAHNQQSWRFIVARSGKKKALANLVTSRAGHFPRPASVLLRMAARSILSASVVVAVANTGELISHGTQLFKVDQKIAGDFFRTMEIQSSAAAVENMLLAATSLGLATVWLGILILIKDEVLELLGEPKCEFMAVVPIGYPRKPGRSPKKRSLDTVVKVLSE